MSFNYKDDKYLRIYWRLIHNVSLWEKSVFEHVTDTIVGITVFLLCKIVLEIPFADSYEKKLDQCSPSSSSRWAPGIGV